MSRGAGSVLYRICGTARVDRESVDATLKGSTGERSDTALQSSIRLKANHIKIGEIKNTIWKINHIWTLFLKVVSDHLCPHLDFS